MMDLNPKLPARTKNYLKLKLLFSVKSFERERDFNRRTRLRMTQGPRKHKHKLYGVLDKYFESFTRGDKLMYPWWCRVYKYYSFHFLA